NQEQQGADYSGVWRVDNERRRRIIQSQQSVLAYLASARTQFLRHWFDDEFGSEGCAFWDYIDELIAQPTPCGDEIGDGLEREMHAHRMSLACLLLEQMCADLAANLCTVDGSIFVKASSEAVRASGRALYPATFMGKLERYFARAAGSPSTREDQRLAALLLDMLAAVARLLFDQPCGARASAIAKLAGLDMFALEAVDYMLSAWYSVDHEYVGTTRASLAQALSRPPSIEKAALRLRITRPPPKEDSPAGWHCLVRVLAALVQRSMRAFSMRLCRANVHPTSDCAADAACPVTIMVASGTPGAGALWDACQELTRRVASRIPRPDALAAAADVRDDRSDSGDDERALYVELDLLDSFMAHHPEVGGRLASIKHVVLVLSGKGGVGKSSCTVQLALSLVSRGHRVGVLDIDLCGPSIPRMLGLEGHQIHQASAGWVPVFADSSKRLACMSIGFLLPNKNASVVWRGPKKNAMIKLFLADVYWGDLDYLLIDTPPGTSDEHLAAVEYLQEWNPDGAVIVTTPQGVALSDVKKEISFCRTVGLPILGLIENMSGFVCPHCAECTNVFSTGGGEGLAKHMDIHFLGRAPIDPNLVMLLEQEDKTLVPNANDPNATQERTGSIVETYQRCALSSLFAGIAQRLEESVGADK
ncbi:cytosolic Fe-S cluster assembly factor cfd1, partial [Coemansia biformis]